MPVTLLFHPVVLRTMSPSVSLFFYRQWCCGYVPCLPVDSMRFMVFGTRNMAGGRELGEPCTGNQHQHGQEPLQPTYGCDEQAGSAIRTAAESGEEVGAVQRCE